jgi:UDP-N-acetylglucosamine--N-acetylmuramyl-(pentapeptide) pyrophosphoryl-undecaprenol N-acetylglucosamine transferase
MVVKVKVLISGGGTAGHINPAITIAKYFKQKANDTEILFIGTSKGLETKLVPREGFELKLIKVRGFKRKISIDTIASVKEMFQGFLEARKIIKAFKPDIVVGTGGYVCGPVLFNAAIMKIPTLIHEQNAFPGVTNRILSRFVDSVAISFKESIQFFKAAEGKMILTGNPVRPEMLENDREKARLKLGINSGRAFVLIFGGSRGAEKINECVAQMIINDYKIEDCDIYFATGEKQYGEISKQLENVDSHSLKVVPYIYEMSDLMNAADLVICRAGAITISELTALGIPSIMIPSPYVTANHQEHNARALEKQGAAVVIMEKDLNHEILYHQIKDLLKDREQLGKMARNAKKIGITNAVEKIYLSIQQILKRN